MLTTAEVREVLSRVTYKPGWQITCYHGQWEGQHLVIKTQVIDSTDLSKTVDLDVHTCCRPWLTSRR